MTCYASKKQTSLVKKMFTEGNFSQTKFLLKSAAVVLYLQPVDVGDKQLL